MARQKLGQHFLIKGSVLDRIAAAACPDRESLVVEIGPGRGALTERLLKRADRIVAVEIDPYLADHLRHKFPGVEVVQADVLAIDLGQWGNAPIAGNLPYYITSPIIEKVVRMDIPRAVFLIQKEVAERLTARPGSRAYGFLTVQTALFAEARMLFEVKPSAFHPPPKVDSAVVVLEPHGRTAPEGLLEFVGRCFHQKRKTIRNNLAPIYGSVVDDWPEARLRAEQIPVEGFAEMYGRIAGLAQ